MGLCGPPQNASPAEQAADAAVLPEEGCVYIAKCTAPGDRGSMYSFCHCLAVFLWQLRRRMRLRVHTAATHTADWRCRCPPALSVLALPAPLQVPAVLPPAVHASV